MADSEDIIQIEIDLRAQGYTQQADKVAEANKKIEKSLLDYAKAQDRIAAAQELNASSRKYEKQAESAKIAIDKQIEGINKLIAANENLDKSANLSTEKLIKETQEQASLRDTALNNSLNALKQLEQAYLAIDKIPKTAFNFDTFKAFGEGISTAASSIGAFLSEAGAVIGPLKAIGSEVFAAGSQLVNFVSDAAKYNRAIKTLSDVTGLSVKTVAALHEGADQLNVPFTTIVTGVDKFSEKLVGATTKGGEALKSFTALGFSVDDLKEGLNNTDAFFQTVNERLNALPAGADKAAIGFDLFGARAAKAFTQITPHLDELKQAVADAGVVLDSKLSENLERFAKVAVTAQAQIQGFQQILAAKLAPALSDVGEDAEKTAKRLLLDPGIAKGYQLFIDIINDLVKVIGITLVDVSSAAIQSLAAIGNSAILTAKLLTSPIQLFETLSKVIQDGTKDYDSFVQTIIDSVLIVPELNKIAGALSDVADKAEQLQQQVKDKADAGFKAAQKAVIAEIEEQKRLFEQGIINREVASARIVAIQEKNSGIILSLNRDFVKEFNAQIDAGAKKDFQTIEQNAKDKNEILEQSKDRAIAIAKERAIKTGESEAQLAKEIEEIEQSTIQKQIANQKQVLEAAIIAHRAGAIDKEAVDKQEIELEKLKTKAIIEETNKQKTASEDLFKEKLIQAKIASDQIIAGTTAEITKINDLENKGIDNHTQAQEKRTAITIKGINDEIANYQKILSTITLSADQQNIINLRIADLKKQLNQELEQSSKKLHDAELKDAKDLLDKKKALSEQIKNNEKNNIDDVLKKVQESKITQEEAIFDILKIKKNAAEEALRAAQDELSATIAANGSKADQEKLEQKITELTKAAKEAEQAYQGTVNATTLAVEKQVEAAAKVGAEINKQQQSTSQSVADLYGKGSALASAFHDSGQQLYDSLQQSNTNALNSIAAASDAAANALIQATIRYYQEVAAQQEKFKQDLLSSTQQILTQAQDLQTQLDDFVSQRAQTEKKYDREILNSKKDLATEENNVEKNLIATLKTINDNAAKAAIESAQKEADSIIAIKEKAAEEIKKIQSDNLISENKDEADFLVARGDLRKQLADAQSAYENAKSDADRQKAQADIDNLKAQLDAITAQQDAKKKAQSDRDKKVADAESDFQKEINGAKTQEEIDAAKARRDAKINAANQELQDQIDFYNQSIELLKDHDAEGLQELQDNFKAEQDARDKALQDELDSINAELKEKQDIRAREAAAQQAALDAQRQAASDAAALQLQDLQDQEDARLAQLKKQKQKELEIIDQAQQDAEKKFADLLEQSAQTLKLSSDQAAKYFTTVLTAAGITGDALAAIIAQFQVINQLTGNINSQAGGLAGNSGLNPGNAGDTTGVGFIDALNKLFDKIFGNQSGSSSGGATNNITSTSANSNQNAPSNSNITNQISSNFNNNKQSNITTSGNNQAGTVTQKKKRGKLKFVPGKGFVFDNNNNGDNSGNNDTGNQDTTPIVNVGTGIGNQQGQKNNVTSTNTQADNANKGDINNPSHNTDNDQISPIEPNQSFSSVGKEERIPTGNPKDAGSFLGLMLAIYNAYSPENPNRFNPAAKIYTFVKSFLDGNKSNDYVNELSFSATKLLIDRKEQEYKDVVRVLAKTINDIVEKKKHGKDVEQADNTSKLDKTSKGKETQTDSGNKFPNAKPIDRDTGSVSEFAGKGKLKDNAPGKGQDKNKGNDSNGNNKGKGKGTVKQVGNVKDGGKTQTDNSPTTEPSPDQHGGQGGHSGAINVPVNFNPVFSPTIDIYILDGSAIAKQMRQEVRQSSGEFFEVYKAFEDRLLNKIFNVLQRTGVKVT